MLRLFSFLHISTLSARRGVTIAAVACLIAPGALTAQTLGTAAGYSVVALGNGKTIAVNSGPNSGDFLLGHGVKAGFAGGGNGSIGGTLFYDNTVLGTNTFMQLQVDPTIQLVNTTVTTNAFNDANNFATYLESLSVTQTYGVLGGSQTITGNGGLNVISLGGINNTTLTLSGSANDVFVFNVIGKMQTNREMILTGGLSGANILFNFLGTSGDVFQTSGGNVLFGTYLATHGGDFQFSNLELTGSLINTRGGIQLVSGSNVTFQEPTVASAFIVTPEPAPLVLVAAGLVLVGGVAFRRWAA